MARIRYNHNSFPIGVLSEKIHGNTDFEGYNNALAKGINFIVQPTGGMFKRLGTVFVAETKDGAAFLKLFTVEDEQFICEFGEGYIRFFDQKGLPVYRNAKKDVLELQTKFTIKDCKNLKTFQDGNVLYILSDKGIFSLSRIFIYDHFVFSLSDDPLEYKSEPMTFKRKDNIWLVPDKDTDTIKFRSCDPDGNILKDKEVFFDGDVGHSLALKYKEFDTYTNSVKYKTIYLKIIETGYDGSQNYYCRAEIDAKKTWDYENITKLPNTDPVEFWQVGAFTKERGLPRAATMYEGRLFLASNEETPNGIWGSSVINGDWTDFYQGTLDSDGLAFKALETSKIRWIIGHTKLFLGTIHGIFLAGSATYNDVAITPSNFNIKKFESTSACDVLPITGMDSVFFVDGSRKKAYEIHLDENGFYKADDISFLSSDFTQSGIIAHAWQDVPIQIYWCVVEDGSVCSLTYSKNNGIVAWSKHFLGGNNVKVEDICTMRGEKNDLVWMVVRREIDGKFVRHIEYIHPDYDPQRHEEFKQFYVDSGVSKFIKYDIEDIERGANPEINFRIYIKEATTDVLESILSSNGGVLQVAFVWNRSSAPPATVLNDHSCFVLRKVRIDNNLLSGRLYDDFSYVFSKKPRLGKPKVPYGKIDPLAFGDTGQNNKYFDLYVKVADVFGVEKDGKIKCDTTHLVYYRDIIFYDVSTRPGVDYDNGGKVFQILQKFADGITAQVWDKDANKWKKIFIGSPTGHGAIFMKCGDNTTFAVNPENCIIKLKTPLKEEIKKYDKIYINKVSGMNQINQRDFQICSISNDRTQITVYAPDQSPSDKHLTVLDTDGYSPFDTVNPDGNVYVYFKVMEGLQHLKGQEVAVCINGNSIGNRIVEKDGTIQLPHDAMYCTAGLPIKSVMQTLPFAGGSAVGSSVGSVGGQKAMWLHLYYSLGGKYGTTPERLYDIPYQKFITDFNKPKSLISGLIKCPLVNAGDVYNRYVYIEHSEPLAFNILSITQDIEVSDS